MIVDTLAQWLLSLPARVPVRPWIKRATLLKLKCFQTFFCFHYASRHSFASTYSFLNQIRVNSFVLKYHVVAREFEYHLSKVLLTVQILVLWSSGLIRRKGRTCVVGVYWHSLLKLVFKDADWFRELNSLQKNVQIYNIWIPSSAVLTVWRRPLRSSSWSRSGPYLGNNKFLLTF